MRRILLMVLFLYSVLDFANPSVPGAVTFDGGVMETAKAERQRPAARPPIEPVPNASGIRPLAPTSVVRMPTRVMRHMGIFIVQRFHAPVDVVAASPTEDH